MKIETINYAQRVNAENGGNGALVFDIGKTAEGDGELIVGMTRGHLLAGPLDIAIGEFQLLPDAFELYSRTLHAMIPLGAKTLRPKAPAEPNFIAIAESEAIEIGLICSESGTRGER